MVDLACLFLILLIIFIVATLVRAGWDPETALTVLHSLVLTGKVNGLTLVTVLAALGQSAGASGELGANSSVLLDPVGKSIFAILDDAI